MSLQVAGLKDCPPLASLCLGRDKKMSEQLPLLKFAILCQASLISDL